MPDPMTTEIVAPGPPPIIVPPGLPDLPLDALDAANALLGAPWRLYIASPLQAAADRAAAELEAKPIASASGGVDGIGWNFSLVAKDVTPTFDLTSPPGFTSAPLLQSPATTVTMAAPLTGTWDLGVTGDLAVTAEALDLFSGETPPVGWGLGIQARLQADVELDTTTLAWPRLRQATVQPQLTVSGSGAIGFPAVNLGAVATVAPGKITVSAPLTDLSVGIDPRLEAALTADLTVEFEAIPAASVDGAGQPVMSAPTMLTTVTLLGNISFTFPSPVGRQGSSFALSYGGLVPLPETLHRFLSITGLPGQGLPREIGKLPDGSIPLGGQTPAPGVLGIVPPNGRIPVPATAAAPDAGIHLDGPVTVLPITVSVDYDGTAALIDHGLQATHLPYDAVFAIETVPAGTKSPPAPNPPGEYYADEEDSAIWTGHLLAAASYRYAATRTPESLLLVRRLMSGIDRLFWVASGEVVKGGQTSAVSAPGATFARSALPDNSPIGWWQAATDILHGRAYYQRSETVSDTGDGKPSPAAIVWRGVGCGGTGMGGDCTTDHPVSRDQYIGIFYGLYAAYQFVADPDVQAGAQGQITALLTYLLENNWNLPLPPASAVCTSYLGAFDHQLALLRIGASVNPQAFQAAYARVAAASAAIWLPIWVTALDPLDGGYYKFNLSHAAFSPLLLAEDTAELRQNYRQAYDILRYATAHHRNAYFNLVRILVEVPTDRAAAMAIPSGSNPGLPLAEEIQSTLAEYVRRLGLAKASNGLPTSAFPDPAGQLTLWPDQAQPYTQLFEGNRSYIAPYCLPVYERNGSIMEFIWQNDPVTLMFSPDSVPPLPETGVTLQMEQIQQDINNNSDPGRECSGLDYLLPYWLAVYLGVLPTPA
jgi:hypothetical protein